MRPIRIQVLLRKEDNLKKLSFLMEDQKNVKPVHSPLLRPKAKPHTLLYDDTVILNTAADTVFDNNEK